MSKRKQKERGKCIFCGGTGMSKEHVWSDWLKQELGEYTGHTESAKILKINTKSQTLTVQTDRTNNRPGNPMQRKVRKVCETCNNGWMGRAVNAARPVATKLIHGAVCYIEDDEVIDLARWLAITTIMQEFVMNRIQTIPTEDRVWLMENNRPPDTWRMWIGYNGSRCKVGSFQAPGKVKFSKNVGGEVHLSECDCQVMTLILRRLLVHVYTATESAVVDIYSNCILSNRWPLVQIWPPSGDRIMWPNYPIFDPALDRLSSGLAVAKRVGPLISYSQHDSV